jgi:hypothetical protein
MDVIAMFAAGMFRPLNALQIDRAYSIVRIISRRYSFLMVWRISWESREVLVELPQACANRFPRGAIERINNGSFHLSLTYMGSLFNNEPVLRISGNGFAMMLF